MHVAKRLLFGTFLWVATACADGTASGTQPADAGMADATNGNEAERPDGWESASHARGAPADYDRLFEEGVVQRIDIVMDPASREAMLADMDELLDPLGSSGGLGTSSVRRVKAACTLT